MHMKKLSFEALTLAHGFSCFELVNLLQGTEVAPSDSASL